MNHFIQIHSVDYICPKLCCVRADIHSKFYPKGAGLLHYQWKLNLSRAPLLLLYQLHNLTNYWYLISNKIKCNHGFSQDFRIGCPKMHIWGEYGVQLFFIPLQYTQKIWILGCPKSAIGCPKRQPDTPLAKGLSATLQQIMKCVRKFGVGDSDSGGLCYSFIKSGISVVGLDTVFLLGGDIRDEWETKGSNLLHYMQYIQKSDQETTCRPPWFNQKGTF